jgi:hypothetical protein
MKIFVDTDSDIRFQCHKTLWFIADAAAKKLAHSSVTNFIQVVLLFTIKPRSTGKH